MTATTTTTAPVTEPVTAPPSRTPSRTAPADGLASMLAYLTRVLKTPTIGRCWEELAEQARDENWSHEDYLAAVLQRQVAERESAGTTMRIRTAHFPAVKTIEDFNLDHDELVFGTRNGTEMSVEQVALSGDVAVSADRGHLPPRRPQQHRRHRARLPPRTAAGPRGRSRRHGHPLPPTSGGVVTHFVT